MLDKIKRMRLGRFESLEHRQLLCNAPVIAGVTTAGDDIWKITSASDVDLSPHQSSGDHQVFSSSGNFLETREWRKESEEASEDLFFKIDVSNIRSDGTVTCQSDFTNTAEEPDGAHKTNPSLMWANSNDEFFKVEVNWTAEKGNFSQLVKYALDGTDVEEVSRSDLPTSIPHFADLNANGTVDLADWLEFKAAFNSPAEDQKNSSSDLNQDGLVTMADFLIFTEHFGEGELEGINWTAGDNSGDELMYIQTTVEGRNYYLPLHQDGTAWMHPDDGERTNGIWVKAHNQKTANNGLLFNSFPGNLSLWFWELDPDDVNQSNNRYEIAPAQPQFVHQIGSTDSASLIYSKGSANVFLNDAECDSNGTTLEIDRNDETVELCEYEFDATTAVNDTLPMTSPEVIKTRFQHGDLRGDIFAWQSINTESGGAEPTVSIVVSKHNGNGNFEHKVITTFVFDSVCNGPDGSCTVPEGDPTRGFWRFPSPSLSKDGRVVVWTQQVDGLRTGRVDTYVALVPEF